jgi:hypothetical protein
MKDVNAERMDVEAILGGFLDFPNTVVDGAGWAWASMSSYTSHSSFEDSIGLSRYAVLDYALVRSLSYKLLDDYMSFKCLLKGLKATMNGLKSQDVHVNDHGPDGLSLQSLIVARSEIRDEMANIKEAIEVISRDPWILLRQRAKEHHRDPTPSTDLRVVSPQRAVGTNGVKTDVELNDILEQVTGIEQLVFNFGQLQSAERWKHLIGALRDKDSTNTNNTVTVTQCLDANHREYQDRLGNALSEYKRGGEAEGYGR